MNPFHPLRKLARRSGLLLLMLSAAGIARADLQWDATQLQFHPAIADKDVYAEFSFVNSGTDTVTIDAVESACGCTTAALDKMAYQPGEKGKVTATFHIGDRTGLQDKVIRVRIHGTKAPTVLTMATYIPEVMKIDPHYVFWRAGEPPQPRMVKISVLPGVKVSGVHAITLNPDYKVTLQTRLAGQQYVMLVSPTAAATANATATFEIHAIVDPGVSKVFRVFANIIPR